MSFWKILGGAAIGVGAVAAAPFTGGGSVLGAATLIGSLSGAGAIAAGAGVAGAAAGAAMGKKEKSSESKKTQRATEKARQEAKAQYTKEIETLTKQVREAMADIAKREQFIVTAFALGICCANVDGHICDNELEELDILVSGIGTSDMLSKTTKTQISKMRNNPPNLATVWAMIEKHGFNNAKHLAIFSNIVEIMIEADGKTTACETEFVNTWNTLAA